MFKEFNFILFLNNLVKYHTNLNIFTVNIDHNMCEL